jgi:hypothetical protein
MFDCQCKRIHEYKRQHLNLLHAITLWDRLRRGDDIGASRTIIFAGKAAPAYRTAKLIIRLAHGIADTIAGDPRTRDRLRVVFVPDFSVKNAQRIYPAADLSEQISTAGMEASGTGNMKFTLNGAHDRNARRRERRDPRSRRRRRVLPVRADRGRGDREERSAARRATSSRAMPSSPPRSIWWVAGRSRTAIARCSRRSSTISSIAIRSSCSPTSGRTSTARLGSRQRGPIRGAGSGRRSSNVRARRAVLVGPRDPRVRHQHLEHLGRRSEVTRLQ